MKTKAVEGKLGTPETQAMLADQSVSVIVTDFHGVNWHEKCKVFPCFVVYRRPKDFKHYNFVVRIFDGDRPLRLLTVGDTLEDARKTIPKGFLRVPPTKTDDPIIVETWV